MPTSPESTHPDPAVNPWLTDLTVWIMVHNHPDEGTLISSPYVDRASALESMRQLVLDTYIDGLELPPSHFEDAWRQGFSEGPDGLFFDWSDVTVGGVEVFESYEASPWVVLKDPGS